MEIYYVICRALSWGLLIGFFLGGFKLMAGRKEYTEKQVRASKLLLAKITGVVKYLTILTLILGLLYFLILGCAVPEQAEYATNMSQLIVSVLTVISIIFAFLEFVRRTDDR